MRWRPTTGQMMFLVAGVLLTLLLQFFLAGLANRRPPASVHYDPVKVLGTNRWGDLEVVPIVLERPEEFFQNDIPTVSKVSWFVRDHTPKQLQELLGRCGFTPGQMAGLMETNRWRVTEQGIWIEPPLDMVRDMAPEVRENLYRTLAEYAENVPQRYPYIYRKDGFDEWFAACGLPAETLATVRKMTYVDGERLIFSDSQYLQATLPRALLPQMAHTLARVPTVLMKLKVDADANIDALLGYWGSPVRNRSLKPFLQSMARVPGGASMAITYFFPPVPRLLVYSYPNPANLGAPKPPDCFWTAMNFANDAQDHRFLDSAYTTKVLATEYQKVPKADCFGDVILLYEPGPGQYRKTVHMCVYIAADIVYTKNGADLFQPWVLMHLDDMMVNYPRDKGLSTAVFRRKIPAPAGEAAPR